MARALTDKAHPPTDADFQQVLGTSAGHWRALLEGLEATRGRLRLEWKFYGGTGAGWTRKVLHGTRNLFFVMPHDGHFVVAFVLGDKAVAAVERSALPPALVQELMTARRYAEGRGLRIPVTTPTDVATVLTLAALKESG